MATNPEVVLVDDLTGDPADTTVKFALNETEYKIDPSMRTPLRCGRRSLGTSTQRERCRAAGAAARKRRSPLTRATTRRLCARGRPGRGFEVNARGRIKADVVQKFRAAGN